MLYPSLAYSKSHRLGPKTTNLRRVLRSSMNFWRMRLRSWLSYMPRRRLFIIGCFEIAHLRVCFRTLQNRLRTRTMRVCFWLWSQLIDATLYLWGKRWGTATDQRLRRGFTAAGKTELWDRRQRGESLKAIGRAFGKPSSSIYYQVAPHGGIGPPSPASLKIGTEARWTRGNIQRDCGASIS